MWQYKHLMSYMVINSLILSMWHAYNNYNFEVYIKLEEILSKGKKTVWNLLSKGTQKHQHITRGYVFLPVLTSCTVGIMAPVYVDWLIKLARWCIASYWVRKTTGCLILALNTYCSHVLTRSPVNLFILIRKGEK